MKVSELAAKNHYQLVTRDFEDAEIENGYTSDLLSDVMGNAEDNSILITIQSHKNTVAVASLVKLSAILVCNDREIPQDMIEAAEKERVAILKTEENQFIASHRVYQSING